MKRKDDSVQKPHWMGVHHIAAVTADLDGTLRFYCDILGMQPGPVVPQNEQRTTLLHQAGRNGKLGHSFFRICCCANFPKLGRDQAVGRGAIC